MAMKLTNRQVDHLPKFGHYPNMVVAVPESTPTEMPWIVEDLRDAKSARNNAALNSDLLQYHRNRCTAGEATHTTVGRVSPSSFTIHYREYQTPQKWRSATIVLRTGNLLLQESTLYHIAKRSEEHTSE